MPACPAESLDLPVIDDLLDRADVATHIGYAISAYNSVQAPIQRMVPWLDKYIRHSFSDTMKKWQRKDKVKKCMSTLMA